MRVKVQLVISADDGGPDTIHDVAMLEKDGQRIEQLGLTLAEVKQLLTHAVAGVFDLYLSEAIIEETRDVLLHREHLRKRFIYTEQDVEEFCLLLRAFARAVPDVPALHASRDPADDYVIATAVAAGVSYLVTRDKDLLTLKTYQAVQMIRPEGSVTDLYFH